MLATQGKIELDLPEGFILSGKFQVQRRLGKGWEGVVYSVKEISTGIERAAKIFYPRRNQHNKAAKFYAKKLHKLRHCSILIQYLTQEKFEYNGYQLTYLISEFVEGETLDRFLKRQKGQRLHPFQALHLLHSLAKGIEDVHRMKEYHGDLHLENIIVQRHGLRFELKLIDMFYWGAATKQSIRDDVFDLVRILYDSVGGQKHYAQQPPVIKDICCGLKKSLLARKFKTAGQLRAYLENLNWDV